MASTESEHVDENAVRMEKFRQINKRGHASQSSIQAILYYEGGGESASNTFLLYGKHGKTIFYAGLIESVDDSTYRILYLHKAGPYFMSEGVLCASD